MIWFFWMQGMEDAPLLVKRCYASLCKNIPKDFDIVLLTEKNIQDYLVLPEFILEKYKAGIISTTHLSDIIRVELLCSYGGCWIDATVYCMDKIPSFMLSGDMFLFKLQSVITNPVLKMSSWWIYAKRGNRILNMTRQMLREYWKREEGIRNYYLLHIMMSKIIDEDSTCRAIFNSIPYFNSGNAHVLWGKLAQEYDKSEYEIIKQISVIQKLSYKKKFLRGDICNYYNAIVEDKIVN